MSDSEDESVDPLLRAVARAPAISLVGKLEPGARIGAFMIVGELGAGGMGEVYCARDERLQREVALKVIRSSDTDSTSSRRRFLREARAAAAVSHPNVATVFEVGEHEGRIFIAMELARGKTLREKIREGPILIDETMRIGRSIAAALSQAHDAGVLHRDLKPENVIVGPVVKVLDFGLARIEDSPSDLASTSAAGVAGTPAYMSPEQAMGRSVDARTDVYALGVVLYEMLVGERPFGGTSPIAVGIATARDPHLPLRARRAEVPSAIEAIVDRCLAKDPDERFADAGELLRALEVGASTTPALAARPASARKQGLALLFGVLALSGIAAWALRGACTAPIAETSQSVSPRASEERSMSAPIETAETHSSTSSLPPTPTATPQATTSSPPARSARPIPSAKPTGSSRDPLADQY